LLHKLKTLIDVTILNVLIDCVCKVVLDRQPINLKLQIYYFNHFFNTHDLCKVIYKRVVIYVHPFEDNFGDKLVFLSFY